MSSWLSSLRAGLSKTSSQLGKSIEALVTHRKLDEAMLEALEEALITSDMGVATAQALVQPIRTKSFGRDITTEQLLEQLADAITPILEPVAKPLVIDPHHRPYVMMVVGVNGNGKTTSVGKLAYWLTRQGYSVMLAACDTFRAAAVDQLKVWAKRADCQFVSGAPEADPASVAFQALEQAAAQPVDVLIIDTAGRQHTHANLMAELQKIVRVIQKHTPSAPHATLQVLDGTTGQNALVQVRQFKEICPITGLIVTKLDGTAKAGVVVALAQQFGLPIHAIGVGEGAEDLQPFAAASFARALTGLASV